MKILRALGLVSLALVVALTLLVPGNLAGLGKGCCAPGHCPALVRAQKHFPQPTKGGLR